MNRHGLTFAFTSLTLLLACGDGSNTTSDDDGAGAFSGGGDDSWVLGDLDGDGYDAVEDGGEDCDDEDPSVYPGAPDSVGDGVDQNCDGLDGVDGDGDGFASEASGGMDCDDLAEAVHPGASDDGNLSDEIIHTAEWSTQGTAIAVHDDGSVHILYGDNPSSGGGDERARYVTNAGGTWEESGIDSGTVSGSLVHLAIEGDILHAVYGQDAHHAVRNLASDSAWTTQALGDAFPFAFPVAFAVDSQNGPHLLVTDYANLNYMHKEAEAWNEVPLAAPHDGGAALALDGQNVPNIFTVIDGTVTLTATAPSWPSQVVYDGDADGDIAALVDDEGVSHVLFATDDGQQDRLVYLHDEGGTWSSEVVADLVTGPSIAMQQDDAGTLHAIVGLSHYGKHLFYAVKPAGGAWTMHTLFANDENRGGWPSFTVTEDGTVHLAYLDYGSVFYGTIAAANGVDDDCDGQVW